MDLHQIGTGLGENVTTAIASCSQPHSSTAVSSPSSSSSPNSAGQHLQPFPQQRYHIQHQHQQQHQFYNLIPPPPQTQYSPAITLPPIPITTNTNSHYLEETGSSSSWPRSRALQQQHQQFHHHHESTIKRESAMGRNQDGNGSSSNVRNMDDSMPSTSDFVKKLYKMLEDPSFHSIVCWGPLGDCFVVKDMNEFTKSILPRMFKHSNFASFVRQLNKYDFHKVKNIDDNQFGEHSWTFRHPDFHADRRDALENIKRKVPAQKKNATIPNSTTTSLSSSTNHNHHHHHHSSSSPSMHHNPRPLSHPSSSTTRRSPSPSPSQTYTQTNSNLNQNSYHHLSSSSSSSPSTHQLKQEITDLKSRLLTLESTYESRLNILESRYESRLRGMEMGYEGRMRGLEKNYESVLVEMVGFQRGVAQQDGVVKSLIRCLLGGENENENENERVKQRLSKAGRHHLTTTSTAGFLLPSAPPVSTSVVGQYQLQNQAGRQTSPASSSSSSQPANPISDLLPALSDRSRFLLPPQDLTRDGNVKWGNSKPPPGDGDDEHDDDDTIGAVDRVQGGRGQQQQQQMSYQEAITQIREYHREGLVRSMDGMSGGGDGRVVGGSGDGDGDGGKRGKRKRRESSDGEELGFGVELGGGGAGEGAGGKEYVSLTTTQQQQQQQTFIQPSASTGPSASSSTTWSSTMNIPTYTPLGEDEDSPSPSSSSLMMGANEGLHVYTVGQLMPRDTLAEDGLGNWCNDAANTGTNAAPKDLGGFIYPVVESETGVGSAGDVNEDEDVEIVVPPGTLIGPSTPSISTSTSSTSSTISSPAPPPPASSSSSSQKLRVRRATFVPSWAVSPRVLLVDDDAVIRKLSSRFLKIFGCTTDVAVDGIGAVTKMNLEKYDLVLMDILMPKLDGISATNLIRKFDRGTPIISMTVNSKPNEIMEYYSSGMNDILPKPFTKEGLLDMLEKHLMHLKVMQQMTVVPRSVGVPPLSDTNFEQVLVTNAIMMQQQQQQQQQLALLVNGGGNNNNISDALSTSAQPPSQYTFTSLLGMGEEDGRINPLAGMGLSDEQYNVILQNLVNGEKFMGMGMDGINGGVGGSGSGNGGGMKRTMDDVGFGFASDERGRKRSRFEVVD